MSTTNPFELPQPRSPDDPRLTARIDREVKLLLETGVEKSVQAATERARAKKDLLTIEYKKEFGDVAEELVEAALAKTLGRDHIVDAPLSIDRRKPHADENPVGKAQADFFFLPVPGERGVAVQMFTRRRDPLRPEPISPAHFRAEKEGRVEEQAFVRNADGSVTPLALFEPDAAILDRVITEWEGHSREQSPADYLGQSERARLAAQFIAEIRRSLQKQIQSHPHVHEIPIQHACTDAIASIDAFVEEFARKKTGGLGLTPQPPAAGTPALPRAPRPRRGASPAG
ncbi:hypothetical protein HYZ80_03150 [Candidatus Parcubacteria bacterium]|nr:hypothetical protein [Candidatus Parcubacteria bacterium]